MTPHIQEILRQLPNLPGVYQYYDSLGQLLYVGKAKNLSKRVHSYWHQKNQPPWTQKLISEIADIKIVEVNTELDALMLENSLVKSLKPKYNIQLRDDKTFPFLRISKEEFPVFTVTRKVANDKARYIGPLLSGGYARSMLKLLQELYGIKINKDRSWESRSNVPKQIGLGARNLDNSTKYNQNVASAIKFLAEPQPKVERLIRLAMNQAAERHEFERAKILRDKLITLQQLRQTQSLFSAGKQQIDYLGTACAGNLIAVYILFERDGKIIDHRDFLFEFPNNSNAADYLNAVISYLYIDGLTIPNRITVPELPIDMSQLINLLEQKVGRKVEIHAPVRGKAKVVINTAIENAAYQLKIDLLKKSRRKHGLAELTQLLELKKPPQRIEAFDISNLGATSIVGASIVFIDGQPVKSEYRKYKIENIKQDDFASMRELVFRRVNNTNRPTPDLLLIDGGKGQLSAALDALKLAKKDIPIIALAKKEELIFRPNNQDPIILAHNSGALLMLAAIRDEVHRFVLNFHRLRRAKKSIS